MGAVAQIEEIKFPTILNPGDSIVGEIVLKNIGDETTSTEAGYLGVLITTKWDGEEHTLITYSSTKPGETLAFNFYFSVGRMPEIDAELEVVGRIWLGWNGGWRLDDVKTWKITSRTTASLNGYVEDEESQLPVSSALVECDSLYTTTDELGHYKFETLDLDTYSVLVSVTGYIKQYKTLDATRPGVYTLNFRLVRASPMPLWKLGAIILTSFTTVVALFRREIRKGGSL